MITLPTRRLALVAAALSLVVLALPGSGLRQVLWVDLLLAAVVLVDAALAPDPSRLEV